MKIIVFSLFLSINLNSQNSNDRQVCMADTKTYALNKVWAFSNSLFERTTDTFTVDGIIFYKTLVNNLYQGLSFSNETRGIVYFINEIGEKDTLIPDKEISNFRLNIPGSRIFISDYHETLKTPLCEYTDLIAFKLDNYIQYYKKGIGLIATTTGGKLDYYLTEIRYDK